MRTTYKTEEQKTPLVLKRLILITALVSIFSCLFEILIQEIFRVFGPQTYLSLNPIFVANGFFYQPLSYLFVYGRIGAEISFGWLFGLLILLYFLWILGSDLIERMGQKAFLIFYLGLGIFAGLITCVAAYLFGLSGTIAGPGAVILGLLLLWSMFNKDSKIFIFHLFSMQVKWLVAITIGIFLLKVMNPYDTLYFICYVTGILGAWIYGLMAWQQHSPYPLLHPVEQALINASTKLAPYFKKAEGKIIDFRTGEEISDDDRFMDEMLDKISKKGKASLSFFERLRMYRISRRKNRKK